MDNLTHTLTGVALARLGLDKRVPGATLTLALASNLPDIDLVSALGGNVAYLEHHRALTHAFPASPFLAASLAFLLSRGPTSVRPFLPTFFLAWLGVCLHIVFDLWTSYGTRALLPFDAGWYSWDWMFIIDPALLLLLVVACFGPRWFRNRRITGWAMAGVLAYIALRAQAQSLAYGQARRLVGPSSKRFEPCPTRSGSIGGASSPATRTPSPPATSPPSGVRGAKLSSRRRRPMRWSSALRKRAARRGCSWTSRRFPGSRSITKATSRLSSGATCDSRIAAPTVSSARLRSMPRGRLFPSAWSSSPHPASSARSLRGQPRGGRYHRRS